ncbi:MAG: hypothetical protein ACXACF_05135 [Candidatus Hermodarchaeia archaeon]
MKSNLITPMMVLLLLVSLLTASAGTFGLAKRIQPGVDFSGPHFNLNLHGVPDGVEKPVPDDAGSGRHSVFFSLNKPFDLYIGQEGKEWQVTDCDATSDGEIRIVLPDEIWEDTNENGIMGDEGDTKIGDVKAYRVYVVALGKPDDQSYMMLLPDALPASLPDVPTSPPQHIYYELTDDPLIVEGHRKGKKGQGNTGQPVWKNATYLFETTVWLWVVDNNPADGNWWIGDTWDGSLLDCDPGEVVVYEEYWVFDILELTDYWWDVTNQDVRLMQVRFYPILNGKGNGNGNGNG